MEETVQSKGHVHYWLPIENGGWKCNCGAGLDYGHYNAMSHLIGQPSAAAIPTTKSEGIEG